MDRIAWRLREELAQRLGDICREALKDAGFEIPYGGRLHEKLVAEIESEINLRE